MNLEPQPRPEPGPEPGFGPDLESRLESSRLEPNHLEPKYDAPPGLLVPSPATPHPRLRIHRGFSSRYLPGTRNLTVYLPPGYDHHPERSYPVLYMHDGQNLFDGVTSFVRGQTWQIRENADTAIESGEAEPLVIVGIDHAGNRRIEEYTPDSNLDRDWQLGGGEAASYGLLLTRELMPWIAARYRIHADRASTGMAGSSLGGLVTLYLGLRHPEFFGRLGVLSPSVWWNRKSILGYLNERAPEIWERPRLWLDVGDSEGRRTLRDTEQLARRLIANGWAPGETLHFERVAGGAHNEASWARRVRPMLRFLFPAKALAQARE